jgi:hypothetical protein
MSRVGFEPTIPVFEQAKTRDRCDWPMFSLEDIKYQTTGRHTQGDRNCHSYRRDNLKSHNLCIE